MSTIYLLHGFNVRDGGDGTVNKLIPYLTGHGYNVKSIKYGHVGRFGVRFFNDNTAATIASTIEPHSIIIAHSNGAALVYEAAKLGARFSQVFLINPALDSTKDIANTEWTTVFHSPTDMWTRLAAWIPFSNWGSMGAVGFRGARCTGNHISFNLDVLLHDRVGHSGVFKKNAYVAKLAKIIRGLI